MNDFGLGLILSFTDNATAGINNAVNSLDRLTTTAQDAGNSMNSLASLGAFSVIASNMGSAMTSAGGAIISTLTQVIGKVNETGQTLMYAENQLGKLYEGSGRTGKGVLADISQYAKTSIFDFENLIPVVTMLKANGIEAFDSIASSTGRSNQMLMDYAADLAAFNPQMKNAYGTGIRAAMGALNEYIAEGNARSLKAGASLDITALLGEDKGATIEERSRQVADLMEKLNMVGMTAQLAQSPMTKLSNMGDTLFQFIGMISQSGVYDAFTRVISIFADFVNSIPDERLTSIAQAIGDALSTLMVPVEYLAEKIVKLADAFFTFLENNPKMAKFAIIATAVGGALLVLTGIALKAMGSLGYLTMMISTFGKSFSSIGAIMRSGSLKILAALLPLTLTLGVLFAVWKTDFAGIRTAVTTFTSGVVNSFQTAKTAVSGSLADMQSAIGKLDIKNNFFDGLTLAIMKLMVLGRALVEGWNSFELSDDTFEKARELGILPLIEAIFDFLYRFRLFKEGFIEGWTNISTAVKNAIQGLLSSVDGTIFESMFEGVKHLFDALNNNDPNAWREVGVVVGELAAKALLLFAAFKVVGSIVTRVIGIIKVIAPIFRTIVNWGGGVVRVIRDIIAVLKGASGVTFLGKLVEVFKAVLMGGMKLKDALTVVFGAVGTTIAGVVSVISGVVLAITGFVKQLTDGFSWFWEIIKWIGIALAVVGAIILGATTWPAIIVGAIVGALTTAVVLIKDHWEAISTWFINTFSAIGDFFVNLWNSIVNGVKIAVNAIKNFFGGIANWIYTRVIQPVVNFFMTYIYPFIEKIVEIVAKVIEIIYVLIGVAVQWINTNVIQPIAQFFSNLWNGIVTGVQNFIASVQSFFSVVAGWINTNVIQPVATFFSNLWTGIVTGVQNFITTVQGVFSTIVSWIDTNIIHPIATFFLGLWSKIQEGFNAVADTVTGFLKGAINVVFGFIGGIVNGVVRGINAAIDVINAIPGVSISKITELTIPQLATGGVVDKPTTALIGEAGKEAVMPLENNTEWIGLLAKDITSSMASMSLTPAPIPVQSTPNNTTYGDTNEQYMTTNQGASTTDNSQYDQRVVFSEGSIVIHVQSATEEEAERLANTIMEKIKRKQEIENMRNYQSVR